MRRYGPDGLVIGGNGHVVGRAKDTTGCLEDLDAFAREHFDVTATTHRWAAQDYKTADQLPFVGRLLPWRHDVLVATGFDKWGMTHGTAAGLACAATILGRPQDWAQAWDPWRGDLVRQAPELLRLNATVGGWMLGGWARSALTRVPQLRRDPPEGGAQVRLTRTGPVGTSCVQGQVRSVSAVCPHLGGVLRWNAGERSWDCPLHGSRFRADGSRLEGPATRDLRAKTAPGSPPEDEVGKAL